MPVPDLRRVFQKCERVSVTGEQDRCDKEKMTCESTTKAKIGKRLKSWYKRSAFPYSLSHTI